MFYHKRLVIVSTLILSMTQFSYAEEIIKAPYFDTSIVSKMQPDGLAIILDQQTGLITSLIAQNATTRVTYSTSQLAEDKNDAILACANLQIAEISEGSALLKGRLHYWLNKIEHRPAPNPHIVINVLDDRYGAASGVTREISPPIFTDYLVITVALKPTKCVLYTSAELENLFDVLVNEDHDDEHISLAVKARDRLNNSIPKNITDSFRGRLAAPLNSVLVNFQDSIKEAAGLRTPQWSTTRKTP